jgi:hypothetical protein
MRGAPDRTVAVVPVAGLPRLTDYLFNAPSGAQVTIEFCDDRWFPLQAGATYTLSAATNTTLTTLAGSIPAGATRARCYTTAPIYWNLSALNPFTPVAYQIPANTEFDLGVMTQ